MVPVMVDMYAWYNPAISATLTLSFRDGKLVARQVATGALAAGGPAGYR